MLNFLRKEKPYEQEARSLYAQSLQTIREPKFYTDYAAEDTMDTRFDLLGLHITLIIERTLAKTDANFNAETFNQMLFDIFFIDMEQTWRAMGVGDTGIKKRMKKMMTDFNGSLHAYSDALKDKDDTLLTESITRNIYTAETPPPEAIKLTAYIRQQQKALAATPIETLLTTSTLFQES